MSIREEIQITDLEPSFEGGEDIEYVVQIRGIDAQGRPGPWSEELKFTSPQQIPSLQSFNYIPGQAGWRLDNDGTFDVNDAFIRGTLQSSNFTQGLSGWRLREDGFAEFSSGIFRGALQIGSNTFNVDSNGNMFIGGTTLANSPFAVNTNGQIQAMSIDASFITAGTIGANVVYAGTIVASQIISGTINGARIPNLDTSKITTGVFDPVFIPNLSADKITTGTLNANNVTITGTLSAVTLNGVGGSFSGSLTASFVDVNNLRVGSNGVVVSNTYFTRDTSMNISAGNNGMILGANSLFIDAGPTTITGSITAQSATFNQLVDFETTIRNRGMATSATGANVIASGTAFVLRRESSSIRYKKNVRSAAKIENLLNARPVHFDTKDQEEDEIEEKNIYGAIAEEFEQLGLRDLILYNEDNEPESIRYSHIGLAVIPYVKELYDRIEELERRLDGS